VRYITASRRVAQRQQRRTITVLSIVSVVMAALAVAALLLFNEANIQRTAARTQRDTAVFRQLLASSSAALDTQPDLALLYGLEAAKYRNTIDSRTAVYTALDHTSYLAAVLQNGSAQKDYEGFYGGNINANAAFSADGKTLMTADENIGGGVDKSGFTQITLWNVATHHIECRFMVPYAIDSAALSPDGRMVATSSGYDLHLWNAATGASLGQMQNTYYFATDGGIAFSADSTLLEVYYVAFACLDQGCTPQLNLNQITLYNVASLRPVKVFPLGPAPFGTAIAGFSPDGKYLATAVCPDSTCASNSLALWNVATGQLYFTYAAPFNTFAFSAHSTLLAVSGCATGGRHSCNIGRTQLVNLASRKAIGSPIYDYSGEAKAVSLSPDGQTLVTASGLHTLRLWNVSTGYSTELFGHTSPIDEVVFNPDGSYFASVGDDNKVLLWKTIPFTPLNHILSANYDGSTNATFSPDGAILATGNCVSAEITLWNTLTGVPVMTLGTQVLHLGTQSGGPDCALHLAFSPDGKRLAVGTQNNQLFILTILTGQSVNMSLTSPPIGIFDVASNVMSFSPDGRFLVASDSYGNLAVWDASSGAPVYFNQFNNFGTTLFSDAGAAFSPDGRLLAVSGLNNDVLLLDGRTFAQIADLHGPSMSEVRMVQLAFSPDGKTLAALSTIGVMTLWYVTTRHASASYQVVRLTNPSEKTYSSLTFSPDGQMVAASFGPSFGLWYTATNEPVIALQSTDADIASLTFSPNGDLLAEATEDGPLYVRPTPSQWQARACAIANRNFTQAEWQQVFASDPYQKICPMLPGPSST
jgi:WD40 repeat protein